MSANNTWEPEENLECPHLIADYEGRLQLNNSQKLSKVEAKVESYKKKKNETTATLAASTQQSSTPKNVPSLPNANRTAVEEIQPRGFDRGLIPQKIIGATESSGELMFLMKWKNSDESDLVPSKLANVKCPQIVIQFYEEHLAWHSNK